MFTKIERKIIEDALQICKINQNGTKGYTSSFEEILTSVKWSEDVDRLVISAMSDVTGVRVIHYLNTENRFDETAREFLFSMPTIIGIIDTFKKSPDYRIDCGYDKDSGKFVFNDTLLRRKATLTAKTDFSSYPEIDSMFPEYRASNHSVICSRFKEALERVKHALADKDEVRKVLQGAFLEISDNKISLVTADGKRMALVNNIPISNNANTADYEVWTKKDEKGNKIEDIAEEKVSVVIPGKSIEKLLKILSVVCGKNKDLWTNCMKIRTQAFTSPHRVEFTIYGEGYDVEFFSDLTDGKFPNYHQVIPHHADNVLKIEKVELQKILKDHQKFISGLEKSGFCDNDNTTLQPKMECIRPDGSRMIIVSGSEDSSTLEDTLSIEFMDNPGSNNGRCSAWININYLLDGINEVQGKYILMDVNSKTNPIVIRDEVSTYMSIIMQINPKHRSR